MSRKWACTDCRPTKVQMRLIEKSGLLTGKCIGGITQDLSQIYGPYDSGIFHEGMKKVKNQGHLNVG
jgi:hypothetical protein